MRRSKKGNPFEMQSALDALREQGIYLSADCGGRGTCGKCRIRFIKDAPEPTEEERRLISKKELEEGIRLACRVSPSEDIRILPEGQERIEAEGLDREAFKGETNDGYTDGGGNGIVAVDLGTTTIAAAYLKDGKVTAEASGINHQRVFGADVISRIHAAAEGSGSKLRELALEDLESLCRKLCADPKKDQVVISGNTAMQHLFCGLSCEGLGKAPYQPADISLRKEKNITILPGIGAFVGADIVSGIVSVGMDQSESVCLLLDIGTNGEMAVGNRNGILAAGSAAGPAFEGGNISCGMPAVPGAIHSLTIRDGKARYETVGDAPAQGLCGSGVLEMPYELLRDGIMDSTGLMKDPYFETGFALSENVVFTNRDIREIQLAKSAIRSGIEIMLREYGISGEQVETLYLSGGFGKKIDLKKAAGIGLIPEEFVNRTKVCGNTSLAGAVLFAKDLTGQIRNRFLRTCRISREINLAENASFQELFLENIGFRKECGKQY